MNSRAGSSMVDRGRNSSSQDFFNTDLGDDHRERMTRGEAYYHGLDRYPWDNQGSPSSSEMKRRGPGRPKGSVNKKTKFAGDNPEVFNPLLNVLCSVCCKYRGHGMLCPKCVDHCKKSGSCFTCYKNVVVPIEFILHVQ